MSSPHSSLSLSHCSLVSDRSGLPSSERSTQFLSFAKKVVTIISRSDLFTIFAHYQDLYLAVFALLDHGHAVFEGDDAGLFSA
jgi:hypothetical protein